MYRQLFQLDTADVYSRRRLDPDVARWFVGLSVDLDFVGRGGSGVTVDVDDHVGVVAWGERVSSCLAVDRLCDVVRPGALVRDGRELRLVSGRVEALGRVDADDATTWADGDDGDAAAACLATPPDRGVQARGELQTRARRRGATCRA